MTLKVHAANRPLAVLSLLLFALLSQGCISWRVVRTSGPPSALSGVKEVAVAFDYSQLMVSSMSGREMPEPDWVATKLKEDPKYAETWADLKHRFEVGVLEGTQDRFRGAHALDGPVPPGAAVMQVQLRHFKLGQFVPVVNPPTVLEVDVAFLVGGQVTDVISVERAANHPIYMPSVFNVITGLSRSVGDAGGSFLNRATK